MRTRMPFVLQATMLCLVAGTVALGTFADDADATSDAVALVTESDRISYVVGVQIGDQLSQGGLEINPDLLARGIRDVMEEKELALSDEDLQEAMMALQQKMMEAQAEMQREQMTRQREEGPKNLAAAEAFLAENGEKDGIVTLDSGLQYRVITPGEGDTPSATSRVRVHYRGTLLDGAQFDSSYDRGEPAEFLANQVIPGWQEALQLMPVGSKWQLFIPPNLAYGEAGRPSIPPNSLLIFEVELLDIVG